MFPILEVQIPSLSPGIALQSTSSMSAIARRHFEANTDARRFVCLVLVELLLIYLFITELDEIKLTAGNSTQPIYILRVELSFQS